MLGLVGLKHLSPSFTEAIKSSAPVTELSACFSQCMSSQPTVADPVPLTHGVTHGVLQLITVVFAWLILRERTGPMVLASLAPIMVGLLLTSTTDLSFDMVGFMGESVAADAVTTVISFHML